VALGAVDERGRKLALIGQCAQSGDCTVHDALELVVDRDGHAALRAGEVQHAAVDVVAVLAQKKHLCRDLRPLGEVGSLRNVGHLAALVIDGARLAVDGFDEIDLRREAEPLRAEPHRTSDHRFGVGGGLRLGGRSHRIACGGGLGQGRARLIDAAMNVPPVDREVVVGELAVDPLERRQALAVEDLVDHPRGRKDAFVLRSRASGTEELGARRRGRLFRCGRRGAAHDERLCANR
jgi:hypothetical protein